jgi:NADH:ubiquinone oxidoreductase subunit H
MFFDAMSCDEMENKIDWTYAKMKFVLMCNAFEVGISTLSVIHTIKFLGGFSIVKISRSILNASML